MNSVSFWENMWQQVEIWRLIMAFVLGGVIGCVYFKSLQWSINKLSETKHKIRMFAGVALFRIVLFFLVLVLISNRNIIIILVYLLSFFVTKMIILYVEKKKFIKENGYTREENTDV